MPEVSAIQPIDGWNDVLYSWRHLGCIRNWHDVMCCAVMSLLLCPMSCDVCPRG